jgi:hypothetical protein
MGFNSAFKGLKGRTVWANKHYPQSYTSLRLSYVCPSLLFFQNFTLAVDLGRVDLWQISGSTFQADVAGLVIFLFCIYLKYVERLQNNFKRTFGVSGFFMVSARLYHGDRNAD